MIETSTPETIDGHGGFHALAAAQAYGARALFTLSGAPSGSIVSPYRRSNALRAA